MPKGKDPASLSKEDALELLRKKREAGPSPKRKAFKRTGKRKKSA
ncbi:topoisomerase C-terminal repeat-containing protein [Streptomyces scabiei]